MTIGPDDRGMWCVYADAACQELIAKFSDQKDAKDYVAFFKDKEKVDRFLSELEQCLDEPAEDWNDSLPDAKGGL